MVMVQSEKLSVEVPAFPEMHRPNRDSRTAMGSLSQFAIAEKLRKLGEERGEFIGAFGRLLYDATLDQSHEPGGQFELKVFRGEMLYEGEDVNKLRHPEWGRRWYSTITAYNVDGNRLKREGLISHEREGSRDDRLHAIEVRDTYRRDYSNGSTVFRLPDAITRYSVETTSVDFTLGALKKAEAALIAEKTDLAALERDIRNADLNEVPAYWFTRRRPAPQPRVPEPGPFAGLLFRLGLLTA